VNRRNSGLRPDCFIGCRFKRIGGEESSAEGRVFAWIADGVTPGSTFELPALGNLAFENLLALTHSGSRTSVIGNEDTSGGQLYLYAGDKRDTGTDIERAGLTGGVLYGIKANFLNEVTSGQALSGTFQLARPGD
jgi:hypothetical protein